MRKLKIIEHISLDGVVQVSGEDGDFPFADWTAPYRTPAGRDAILAAHGERFFAEGTPPRSFELVGTKAMPSGIILSTYEVAGSLKIG